MSEFDTALRYIFVLSFILIIVAYYAGSKQILTTGGTVAVNLLNASTGRTSSGTFAGYPANAPNG